MTDATKTVSDGIASKPAEAPVSAATIPADCRTKAAGDPKVAAEALPSAQKPVATPELLRI
jgi:hypothetical protein